jgi:sugar phosphate isomerase/epimerase
VTGAGSSFRAGLCTVSFRSLERAAVVDLAAGAGLGALEWGGDVHVPHGDLRAAADAATRSSDAGLEVVSYGSYLFLDAGAAAHLDHVLDTAAALGAPAVRVWCAHGVEPGAPAADRGVVVAAASLAAERAAGRGMSLTLEFHAGTLTATTASTTALLDEVGAPNLFTAWQPPYWDPLDDDTELAGIRSLAPRLSHVHVYDWDADLTRHPLSRQRARWRDRLGAAVDAGAAAAAAGVPRAALIEFVPGDDPEVLGDEAAALRWCLASI